MRVEDCFELGFILKTHGLKGDLYIVMDSDEPDFYAGLTLIFLQAKSGLVPFAVTAWKPQRKGHHPFRGCGYSGKSQ